MSMTGKTCGNIHYGDMRSRGFTYPEQIGSLPVELRHAGWHYVSTHEYSWDGRNRRDADGEKALIQYTLSGAGAVEYEGIRYEVPPGFAMLLVFPENHRYFLPEESDHWEVLFLSVGGGFAPDFIRMLRKRFGSVVPLRREGEVLFQMKSLLDNPPPSNCWDASAVGYRILTGIGNELEHHNLNHPRPEFIDRVLDYCRTHADRELDVERLSRIAGLSRWHFSREFKRALGVTVPQYVTELRMRTAAQLLADTHFSIKEIAGMCGFSDPAYFIRCFARHSGVTPGAFRKFRSRRIAEEEKP